MLSGAYESKGVPVLLIYNMGGGDRGILSVMECAGENYSCNTGFYV